jgi:hypothetical protein
MGWFRFDDAAIDHPKFLALSDGGFRLWVEAGAYCNKHLTDGRISPLALKGFRYATKGRIQELMTVNLWERSGDDVQMHDYLQWNDARDVVMQKKAAARGRTQKWRDASRDASQDAHVLRGVDQSGSSRSSERESERKPSAAIPAVSRRDRDYGRIFLHAWQQHALIANLGPHADTFELDEWISGLSAIADAQGITFPNKDIRWAWVQAQLHEECQRRGLPIASSVQPGGNKRIAGLVAGGEAFLERNRRQM